MRPGVIVKVARIVRIDATLQVGAATDAVTVEAASPLLKTESGEISQNRVPGVSLFSKDPNSHSIDPTTDLRIEPCCVD